MQTINVCQILWNWKIADHTKSIITDYVISLINSNIVNMKDMFTMQFEY